MTDTSTARRVARALDDLEHPYPSTVSEAAAEVVARLERMQTDGAFGLCAAVLDRLAAREGRVLRG